MTLEWDPKKRDWTLKHRGIDFADIFSVLEDECALTVIDRESDPTEERFVTLGHDALGRLIVLVYMYRDENIRIISARYAEPHEREEYLKQR